MRFEKRVMLVTGATSGIGRACARHLAAEGARVAAAGRRKERLAELAADFTAQGHELLTLEGDVRDEAMCERWVRDTVTRFGALDGLVNAAGVLGPGSAADTTTAEWDRVMDSNVRSVF